MTFAAVCAPKQVENKWSAQAIDWTYNVKVYLEGVDCVSESDTHGNMVRAHAFILWSTSIKVNERKHSSDGMFSDALKLSRSTSDFWVQEERGPKEKQ